MQPSTSMPKEGGVVNLKIPDLFESFRSLPPKINPLYSRVNEASLKWLSEICGFDEAAQDRLRKADFAYIAATAFPDVEDFDRLLVITNWFNWVFFFDDQLDDTAEHEDKEPARRYIDSFVTVLDDDDDKGPDSDREEQPSRYIFRCIWQAVKQDSRCPPEAKLRWADSMKRYFAALRRALIFQPSPTLAETVEGYISYRFHTVGVLPIFAFVEYFYALCLPSEVWTHPEMIGLRETGVKMAMMWVVPEASTTGERRTLTAAEIMMLSRTIERRTSVVPITSSISTTSTACLNRMPYDIVGQRQHELYRRWYTHRGALPPYGEHQDGEIQRYLRGAEQVVTANLNWSFRTQRYFGENVAQVRQTRVLPGNTQWLDGVIPQRGLLLVTADTVHAKTPATSTKEHPSVEEGRAVLVGA